MSNTTFTANGILAGFTTERESETFVYLGLVNSAGADVSVDFGTGTITIAKLAGDGSGNFIPLKVITTLDSADDRASRFILPPNQEIAVILSGSTSPDLYVELQSGPRRNP